MSSSQLLSPELERKMNRENQGRLRGAQSVASISPAPRAASVPAHTRTTEATRRTPASECRRSRERRESAEWSVYVDCPAHDAASSVLRNGTQRAELD